MNPLKGWDFVFRLPYLLMSMVTSIFPASRVLGAVSSNIWGKNPGEVQDMSGKYQENSREMSGKASGMFPKIFGRCPGDVREIAGDFPGDLPEISRRDFPEMSNKIWRFPGNFMNILVTGDNIMSF